MGMNVKNCRKCGKMFNYIVGEPICPLCREKNEEKFQEVKKFIQDNKKANINEICEACDVDQKQVRQWVREERLVFSEDSPVKINCEGCGAQISTGRFCARCKKDNVNNFGAASKSAEAPAGNQDVAKAFSKMYTRR